MMLADVCLSDVCLMSVTYIWSTGGVCGRPAGWCVLADRAQLGRPDSLPFVYELIKRLCLQ